MRERIHRTEHHTRHGRIGGLVPQPPREDGWVIDVLQNERRVLILRVHEKRRTRIGTAVHRALRVDENAGPITRVVKRLRVLIVRRADDGGAHLGDHRHVGTNVRVRLRPAHGPAIFAWTPGILVHVHADKPVRMTIQHKSGTAGRIGGAGIGIGVERHRPDADTLTHDIEQFARDGIFDANRQGVEVRVDAPVPHVRARHGAAAGDDDPGRAG